MIAESGGTARWGVVGRRVSRPQPGREVRRGKGTICRMVVKKSCSEMLPLLIRSTRCPITLAQLLGLRHRRFNAPSAGHSTASIAVVRTTQGATDRRAAAAVAGVDRVKPGTVVARRQGMSMREDLVVARTVRDAASLLPLQTKDGM